jgi:hypothetical protein
VPPFTVRFPAPDIAVVENVVLPLPATVMFDVAVVVTPPVKVMASAAESLLLMKKLSPVLSETGAEMVSVPVVPVKLIPVGVVAEVALIVSVLLPPRVMADEVLNVMLPKVVAAVRVGVSSAGVVEKTAIAPLAFGAAPPIQFVPVLQVVLVFPVHVICPSSLPLTAISNHAITTMPNLRRR